MFHLRIPLVKEGAHADDRLAERTNLDPSVLRNLRRDVKSTPIPYGSHHVVLDDGSFAVLKDVSRKGQKRHVVATVLSPEMNPPGTDITETISNSSEGRDAVIRKSRGKNAVQESGSQRLRSRLSDSGKYGTTRRERIKNRLKDSKEKGGFSHKKIPGGFSSSSSYSYSSSEKAASFIGAGVGAYSAGEGKKNKARGAIGGAIGGQALGWAGTGAGIYAAHKAGYTKGITQGRSVVGATKYMMRHPVKSMKALGPKGAAIIGTASIGSTIAGGYLGGKYLSKPKGVKK